MVKSKNNLNKILKNKSLFWFAIILSIIQLCIFIKEKSYKCLFISSISYVIFILNLVITYIIIINVSFSILFI